MSESGEAAEEREEGDATTEEVDDAGGSLLQQLRASEEHMDRVFQYSGESGSEIKALAAALIPLLDSRASADTVQETLKTIAAFRKAVFFNSIYQLLYQIDREAAAPGLFILLLERSEPEMVIAVANTVFKVFAAQVGHSPEPAIATKAVGALCALLETADKKRREAIIAVFSAASIGTLGSLSTTNKVSSVILQDIAEKLMSPNTTADTLLETAVALNQLSIQADFFPSSDAPEEFKTAVETAAGGALFPVRFRELLCEGLDTLAAGEDAQRVTEPAILYLLQDIDRIVDAALVRSRSPLPPSEGVLRRRKAILADIDFVGALRQLVDVPDPDGTSDVPDLAAGILTVLAQSDRSKVFMEGSAEAASVIKLLKRRPSYNTGRMRFVAEYLQDESCATAALEVDPTLLATWRKFLHWGLDENDPTTPPLLAIGLFKDLAALSSEWERRAWDDDLGRDLIIWAMESDQAEVSTAACQLLAAFLTTDPSRTAALAGFNPLPQLRHSLLADESKKEESRSAIVGLLRSLSPGQDITVTEELLKSACEVLLADEDLRAKDPAGPILAWLRDSVLSAPEDSSLKSTIERALQALPEPVSPPPDDQAVAEGYLQMTLAYLQGPSRLARLVLLALATRSTAVTTLVGTWATDPAFDVGASTVDVFGDSPDLSEEAAAYRKTFCTQLSFAEASGTGEDVGDEGNVAIEAGDTDFVEATDDESPNLGANAEQTANDVLARYEATPPDSEEDEPSDADEGRGNLDDIEEAPIPPMLPENEEEEEDVYPYEEEEAYQYKEEEVELSFLVGSIFFSHRRPIQPRDIFSLLASSEEFIRDHAMLLLSSIYRLPRSSHPTSDSDFFQMKTDRVLTLLLEHAKKHQLDQSRIFDGMSSLFAGSLPGFMQAAEDGGAAWAAWILEILERPILAADVIERSDDLRLKSKALLLLVGLDSDSNAASQAAFRREIVPAGNRDRWESRLGSILRLDLKDTTSQSDMDEYLVTYHARHLAKAWGIDVPPPPAEPDSMEDQDNVLTEDEVREIFEANT